MKTLTQLIDEAVKRYPAASTQEKNTLETVFGKDTFKKCLKVTERIKTLDDACAELGIHVSSVTNPGDTPDEAAYKQLKVIVKALNEGWEPNWDDDNEYKYRPWFWMSSSRGFSFSDYVIVLGTSHVGSRLCFKSRELCEYAANQFKDIYKAFFN